jgi:pimeloyl-ACP methyl ester carboxylesterase
MTIQQRTTTRRGVLVGAALLAAGVLAAPAHALRPMIFVHGGSGSGAQFESQAMRFASNGYPADHVRVHEYDSFFTLASQAQVIAGLDALVDQVIAETGTDRVDLLGHSLGTTISQGYLSAPERAAKIAHYVNIDGAQAAAPPGGVATLAIWGAGNPAREIAGAENVYFPNQTHVQVATSAESFAAQYEFLNDAPPATTAILPEVRVQLAGRAVIFPQNLGVDDATLQIFEVDAATGGRLRTDPDATYALSSPVGAFGPFEAIGGRRYEFVILRDDARPHHFYTEPVVRSDFLIRLLTVDANIQPGAAIQANAEQSDHAAGFVLTRYREFWGDQGANSDVLLLNGLNIISPTNSPIAKRVNAMFVGDDDLDGVNDLVAPNAFYFALPFITAMDVFMPAAIPPTGVIRLENTSREGFSTAITVPNWATSMNVTSIVLHAHDQPTALEIPGSKDELKCEAGTSKALAKFVAAKGKCVRKCLDRQRKAGGPYDDCRAPYGGGTAACIADADKGAETKARTRIGKACAKACPACYDAAGNCPDGAGFVAATEEHVDDAGPLVHCLEADGATPDKPQAKCEDRVAKSLIKFTGAKAKCYDKCVDRAFKGKIPAGSCAAGDPSDADTRACIQKAEGKAAQGIDEVCEVPGAKPGCYGARDGAAWAAVIENLVDAQAPFVYCSSPTTTTTITIAPTTSTSTSTTTPASSTTTTTLYGSPSRAFLTPPPDLLR